MVTIQRPNLDDVPNEVIAYIEALEGELERLQLEAGSAASGKEVAVESSEPPTTMNVISVSCRGLAKRTPRHHYARQRRGGMGVFDIDTPDGDVPTLMAIADESEKLLLFTEQGRVFRLPVAALPETEVRSRGWPLADKLPLRRDEQIVAALPEKEGVYVAMVSERGYVRRIRSSFFGRALVPGSSFHNVAEGGLLVAACWTRGNEELFIATRQGQAIRINEMNVPERRGCLGIRIGPDDAVVAIACVQEETGVFLLGADGKGTLRLMSGFRANKSPGAGGKTAMKTDQLVGASSVAAGDDIFAISELGKIIRFASDEVPAKEGVVQGVSCMSLRNDQVMALAINRQKT